jgi:hypothetical protein
MLAVLWKLQRHWQQLLLRHVSTEPDLNPMLLLTILQVYLSLLAMGTGTTAGTTG